MLVCIAVCAGNRGKHRQRGVEAGASINSSSCTYLRRARTDDMDSDTAALQLQT